MQKILKKSQQDWKYKNKIELSLLCLFMGYKKQLILKEKFAILHLCGKRTFLYVSYTLIKRFWTHNSEKSKGGKVAKYEFYL